MAQSSPTIQNAVAEYVRELNQSGIHVQQVLLYGSHAKNMAHVDSDIDIVVLSRDFAGKSLLERLQTLGKALRNISEPIQAYGFTPEEVENRLVSAFWEEIFDTEAVPVIF